MYNFNNLNGKKWGDIMLDEVEAVNPRLTKKLASRSTSRSRSKARLVVPKKASSQAEAFGKGDISIRIAPRCKKGAECNDDECTFFHGPKPCEFAEGKKKDERRRLAGGKPNPQYGKPMPCGKGKDCPFDHRPHTRREKTEKALYERARKLQAPQLHSEADLFAAYPSIEWLAGDSYRVTHMSSLDLACLKLSLEKSEWEYEEHSDFWTIKAPLGTRMITRLENNSRPVKRSKGTRNTRNTRNTRKIRKSAN